MKIINDDDKIVLFLFENKLHFDDYIKLKEEIKKMFIRLVKIYNLDIYGYLKVTIFYNNICGCFIEIEKINSIEFKKEVIDLKLIIYKNIPMYFEFDDYPLVSNIGKMKCNGSKYYIEIKNKTVLYKYIEYGKITYQKNS